MALSRFGAERINDYNDNTETKVSAIHCRLHFVQTAKSLMRSHFWRFAKHRVALSRDTATPDFQWSYQFALPSDFLRAITVYTGDSTIDGRPTNSYELEGQKLLIDDSTCNLRYIRWIEDTAKWDPLFNEVFILQLAHKLVIPLGKDATLKEDITRDLMPLMSKVRALDRNESKYIGREDKKPWRDGRYSDVP